MNVFFHIYNFASSYSKTSEVVGSEEKKWIAIFHNNTYFTVQPPIAIEYGWQFRLLNCHKINFSVFFQQKIGILKWFSAFKPKSCFAFSFHDNTYIDIGLRFLHPMPAVFIYTYIFGFKYFHKRLFGMKMLLFSFICNNQLKHTNHKLDETHIQRFQHLAKHSFAKLLVCCVSFFVFEIWQHKQVFPLQQFLQKKNKFFNKRITKKNCIYQKQKILANLR